MPYTRSGRKRSNRRSRKILTHLPAALYKSLKVKQQGGATWPTTGEYIVQSIVGVGNDGRVSGSDMTGTKCFGVVSGLNSNGYDRNSLRLGQSVSIYRGVDTSGNNTPYYLNLAPFDNYKTQTYNSGGNPDKATISPSEGGSVTFPYVAANLSYVPGNQVFVYRDNDATNTSFFGKVASYTNNGGTATLVINSITSVKGSHGTAILYNIQPSQSYTPQPTFYSPIKIAVDSASNIFIIEDNNNNNQTSLRVYSTANKTMTSYLRFVNQLGSPGSPQNNSYINGSVYQNHALAVDKKSDVAFIADFSYHYIRSFVKDDGVTLSGKTGGAENNGIYNFISSNRNQTNDGNQDNGSFQHPKSIAIDPTRGRGYVGDDNVLMMMDMKYPGNLSTPSGDRYYLSRLWQPPGRIHDMVVDNSGNLFVLCSKDDTILGNKYHAVWKIVPPPPGTTKGYNQTSGNSTAILSQNPLPAPPSGMPALVAPTVFAGDKDSGGYGDGATTNARFNNPMGISVDSKNVLYIADTWNNVIRGITPKGDVFTVAGNAANSDLGGTSGDMFVGDGTNTGASFSFPVSVSVDSADNIYVLDRGLYGNSAINGATIRACTAYMRIRKIALIPAPSAPSSVTVVDSDSISLTLSWGNNSGLTGYEDKGYPAYFQFLIKPSAAAAEVS